MSLRPINFSFRFEAFLLVCPLALQPVQGGGKNFFLYDYKNGILISDQDLSVEFTKQLSQNIPLKNKSHSKQTNITGTKAWKETPKPIILEPIEDELLAAKGIGFKDKGAKDNRSSMRSVILQDLYSCYIEVDEFECIFDHLIDLEESFVIIDDSQKEALL